MLVAEGAGGFATRLSSAQTNVMRQLAPTLGICQRERPVRSAAGVELCSATAELVVAQGWASPLLWPSPLTMRLPHPSRVLCGRVGLRPEPAQHPYAPVFAPSTAIRSPLLPPLQSRSERSCSISNPQAVPRTRDELDCDGCSAASRGVSFRSTRENHNNEPARSEADQQSATHFRGCPILVAFCATRVGILHEGDFA